MILETVNLELFIVLCCVVFVLCFVYFLRSFMSECSATEFMDLRDDMYVCLCVYVYLHVMKINSSLYSYPCHVPHIPFTDAQLFITHGVSLLRRWMVEGHT